MEKSSCMVSILCTAYNHEQYIAQTLDSFLSQQTDFPFEILVSDDASTDGTAEIIRDYALRYPGVVRAFLPHAPAEVRPLVEQEILEREFELMYIEGRDREQRKGPYRQILRRQSRSYRVKNFIKSYVPGLQRLYRRRQGYID